ncbi:adenine phosphoribosyltransferase [Patescibacteria group bacterium]
MTINILEKNIRSISDWPKKGINFRDITPILEDAKLFRSLINELAKLCKGKKIDKVVGIDARGFILASALAYKLNSGLAIVRKKGKLPYKTISKKYTLEYASAILEMHKDSIKKKENILIVDDVLATGGTMSATVNIIKKLGGNIVGILFLIELEALKGRKKLRDQKIESLIKF